MIGLALLNILAFLLISAYAVYLFVHVVYSRYTFIKLGKKVDVKDDTRSRIREVLVQVFGQKKLLKDRKSGKMHVVMFYGFIILQFGALDLIGKGLVPGWHLPLGQFYPYFTFVQELTAVVVLAAVAYAGYRRYIEKLRRLKRGWKAGLVLLFISGLMITVLLSSGMEMIWFGWQNTLFQPVASTIAGVFSNLSSTTAGVLFYLFWWMHLLILLAFLVYVPQSKHAHLLFAPVNIFFKKAGAPGKLSKIDFTDETIEEYGVGKIEDFTQTQLIDLYACVECGRCMSMCPANGTGKTLSPMDLIVKMRDHLTEKGALLTSRTPWMPAFAFTQTKGNRLALAGKQSHEEQEISLIGDVITEEEIWACTTCRNCEDQCPVGNEHVDKIIDLRRYLVLTEGSFPSEAQRALDNIERQGNPWGIPQRERTKWLEGLEEGLVAPTVQETDDFEYLFWVGSMGSFDARSTRITHSLIKVMNKAGIKFAILGHEEKNSGDTARRIGNEFLFQQLAEENIEIFKKYHVTKIITIDPHAYNTLKHEYLDFGLDSNVEVYHHTELIARWIDEGRVQPKKEVKERITYHDSCYLGRYNEIYDSPRRILSSIPGVSIIEMRRSRSDSMCCGAGGGRMWMEENQGKRINIARTEQALEVNPTIIATACPYCLTMLSDGIKAKENNEKIQILDVVEILIRSL